MKRVDNTKLGRSMILCAASRADSFREVDDGAVFNAYWRNDAKTTVKIFASTAAWHDTKTGESGGARDFARLNGMTMAAMSAMFPAHGSSRAPTATTPAAAPKVADLPPLPPIPQMPSRPAASQMPTTTTPPPSSLPPPIPPMPPLPGRHLVARMTEAQGVWEETKADAAAKEKARAYIANERGLRGFVSKIDACYAGYDSTARDIAGLASGRAVAVPLMDTNGDVKNVAFRFLNPRGGPKCMTLAGLGVGNANAPLGFGRMHDAARGAPRVLVVEGLMDTLVAEALVGDRICVVGAPSAGALSSSWMAAFPRVVAPGAQVRLLAHVDASEAGVKHMTSLHRALLLARCNAVMIRWSRLLYELAVPEEALGAVVADLADLLRVRMPEAVRAALTTAMEVTW